MRQLATQVSGELCMMRSMQQMMYTMIILACFNHTCNLCIMRTVPKTGETKLIWCVDKGITAFVLLTFEN